MISLNPNCALRHLNGIDGSRRAAFLSYDQPGFCRHENFERHSGGTTHLALRDGRNSLCARVFCTRDHVCLGNF